MASKQSLPAPIVDGKAFPIVRTAKISKEAATIFVEVQKCLSTPVEDTGPVVLLGFSNLAGRNIVEQAPVGSGYDFVVHVKLQCGRGL